MADDFPWMATTQRTSRETTQKTREDELSSRAFLLARLGYSKKSAEARLKANLEWEYEGIGKPGVEKRVGKLVTEAYRRAGVATGKKR